MARFRESLRNFFFPPPGSARAAALPYATLGVLTLIVLIGGVYGWDYTNSPVFCGTVCHTMPPEYTAYLTSPHARVDCVDCHIGKGFIATRITRKAGDVKHIIATTFNTYEYPIRAGELRPARETCEKCHSPQKFSDDSLRTIPTYGDDKANSLTYTYLVLKTGGGSKRLGLGKGIHLAHREPGLLPPTDPEEQSIPFVRVVNDDGSVTDYTEVGQRHRSGQRPGRRPEGDGLYHLPQPHHPPGLPARGHRRPPALAEPGLHPDPGHPAQGGRGHARFVPYDGGRLPGHRRALRLLPHHLPGVCLGERRAHPEAIGAIQTAYRRASSSSRRSTGTPIPTTSAT